MTRPLLINRGKRRLVMSVIPLKGTFSARFACPLSAISGHLPVRLLAVNGKRKLRLSLLEGAMADPSSRRKLAAILSADVVGYSRLMAANEAATVETLKSYRDIIARLVARRGGRVVNAPGDALLAEFPSAVEAVQAAIEIQKSVEGHNIELETGPAHAVPHWGQFGRCDRRGRRHDLWRWRQHRRAHGGPRRGRRHLHLLHCLRRRRGQAFLRIRFSGRAAGQEHCKAGPRLPRARRAQATVAARSAEAPHAMAGRRAGRGADPALVRRGRRVELVISSSYAVVRKSFDCSPAVREHWRRSQVGPLCRWHYRGHHYRSLPLQGPNRHRSQFHRGLQGQAGRHPPNRPRPQREIRS